MSSLSEINHSSESWNLAHIRQLFLPYKLAFLCSLSIMILELEASRLVARHVGSSLAVWTSVIGIMLMGICLGNALGGRVADLAPPRKLIGPLLALASGLTILSLIINDLTGPAVGSIDLLPYNIRAVILISLDFLIPTTILGMISPIVAKMAVENAEEKGTAIGLIYFLGAVGSIVGTFITGYYLIFVAPTSTIVALVAGLLALLSLYVSLPGSKSQSVLAGISIALIGLGSTASIIRILGEQRANPGLLKLFGPIGEEVLFLGNIGLSLPMLAAYATTILLGITGLIKIQSLIQQNTTADKNTVETVQPGFFDSDSAEKRHTNSSGEKLVLWDIAVLSFLVSLGFMAFEMVAGRLVTRHLGSSIYGWTTVIGVLLGGLSLGNFFGGWISNFSTRKETAATFFSLCSLTILASLVLESPPQKLISSVEWFREHTPYLSDAVVMYGYPWWFRVLIVVTVCFFPASIALGTVSPLLAKIAIDRASASGRIGQSIGIVYAWGMVGSILGTFLTGFYLIDIFGTKLMLLLLSVVMGICSVVIGKIWHCLFAGIPVGLCIIAMVPTEKFKQQSLDLGLREPVGTPDDWDNLLAWIDESQYYYIKVNNEPELDSVKRTIVLDNLIHGYFILNHPEHIEYDYEYIYAQVSQRVAEAKAKAAGLNSTKDVELSTLFLGGGAYTFPRYMQHFYPKTQCDVAEIDPAVLRANQMALGLPMDSSINTTIGDARQFVMKNQEKKKYDLIYGDAFNDFSVPWHLTTREFNSKLANLLSDDGVYMINIIDVYESDKMARERAKKRETSVETELERAQNLGGFLSSWVKTARETFPYVYVYGTDVEPGRGDRETFVVVVSKKQIDLTELGRRENDPKFLNNGLDFEPDAFPELNMKELEVRSKGIILTDDYAPVENLLAPVAATRGEED